MVIRRGKQTSRVEPVGADSIKSPGFNEKIVADTIEQATQGSVGRDVKGFELFNLFSDRKGRISELGNVRSAGRFELIELLIDIKRGEPRIIVPDI